MAGPRNGHGVNETTDCHRTIKGEKYVGWGAGMSAQRIAAYRVAGVRCRRFGDDVFIREADIAKAIDVDADLGPNF